MVVGLKQEWVAQSCATEGRNARRIAPGNSVGLSSLPKHLGAPELEERAFHVERLLTNSSGRK
jgi:hypothetical protein